MTDKYYLVLELYRGGNLFTFIHQTGPLNKRLLLRWAVNLLQAVVFLQMNNVANRDIKPQNLMLTASNNEESDIVLCDLGLSQCFVGDKKSRTNCGTPIYMAPEVKEGKELKVSVILCLI
jgi:serine/threonine protein kinase